MLKRREVVAALLQQRPDNLLVVGGLGSSSWDISAVEKHPGNFCFIGAMGQATPYALGLSLAVPDSRVLLITGDGEMLMSLGALATVASAAVNNLSIVVLDNQSYAETGNQPTATAGRTNLVQVAAGCGFESTMPIQTMQDLLQYRPQLTGGSGLQFATIIVAVEKLPLAFPYSFDGAAQFNRFQAHVTR